MKIKLHTKNKKKYKNKNKKNKKRLRSHKGGSAVAESLVSGSTVAERLVSEHAKPIMRHIIKIITPSIEKLVLSDMREELIREKSIAGGLRQFLLEEQRQKNVFERELTILKISLKETQNQLDEANILLENIEYIETIDDSPSDGESSDGESSDGESSDREQI